MVRDYVITLYRACLAATIRSSGASQSTIKVVATNLIANSRLMGEYTRSHDHNTISITEGVQLLSLIDKGLDACRYLQAYGQWEQAAWLAKVLIPIIVTIVMLYHYSHHCVIEIVQMFSYDGRIT